MPTNPVEAVTTIGSTFRFALRITVRGPGQNAFVRISKYFLWASVISTYLKVS